MSTKLPKSNSVSGKAVTGNISEIVPPCIMCVQYIRGCSVHRGYHEDIGGCSVHRGDTMGTSGGYHDYIRGIS